MWRRCTVRLSGRRMVLLQSPISRAIRNNNISSSQLVIRSVSVAAQRLGERVMARHHMLLAAFLMQPHSPASTLRPEILPLIATNSLRAEDRRQSVSDVKACRMSVRVQERQDTRSGW
jgi:hypothetical protein